jgi:hypothetical protein
MVFGKGAGLVVPDPVGAGVAGRADHSSAAVGEGAGCQAGVRQLLGLGGEDDAGDEG